MIRLSSVVAGLALVPALLPAQTPSKEFGVDVGIAYVKPDGGDGAIVVGTPLDVRIGFLSSGNMSFEPRFTFMYISDVGGNAAYSFSPMLHLLFRMGQGTHQRNTYFTVGAGIDLIGGGGNSANQVNLAAGIGMRRPAGTSAASRIEGFVGYALEGDFASQISIGARLGWSFFK